MFVDKETLIGCFQNTWNFGKAQMKHKINKTKAATMVYPEGFVSGAFRGGKNGTILVERGTTFATAQKYLQDGKTVVLNFANAVHPGGGVWYGAMAQEECLCRSSTLYSCLLNDVATREYYQYHQKMNSVFSSDRLIYTPNITVFKDDSDIPQMMPRNQWFDVDVITCAAPNISNRRYTNLTALKRLLMGRIRNIMEAAIDNHAEVIVLGAFGCGAFKNPPLLMAQAFEQVIVENHYLESFRKIVFAIKSNNPHSYTFSTFQNQFEPYTHHTNGEAVVRVSDNDWYLNRMPELSCLNAANSQAYSDYRKQNPYYGKQFSVLGDALSTLEGYTPYGYQLFYMGKNAPQTLVYDDKDTWWGKVIHFFGGELLVNNSWSGSCVTKLPDRKTLFPSGCSEERTARLHLKNTPPDVIIVYLGSNDWSRGVAVHDDNAPNQPMQAYFDTAYTQMLGKLKEHYPYAEIWCCTLNSTQMSNNPSFIFPTRLGGNEIDEYNQVIRTVAAENHCRLIDLDKYSWSCDTVDGFHPNAVGMDTLATMVIREMGGEPVANILDCPNNRHRFEVVDSYGGHARYICKQCGKVYNRSTGDVSVNEEQSDKPYAMLPEGTNEVFYTDTLHLTFQKTGEVFERQKPLISVGRYAECDLRFDPAKGNIALRHASFLYEGHSWFLRDDYSIGGTWLNGEKIQNGVKYELKANDVIDFARSETVIFERKMPKSVWEDAEKNRQAEQQKQHEEWLKEQEAKQQKIKEQQSADFLIGGILAWKKAEEELKKAQEMQRFVTQIIGQRLVSTPMYFPVTADVKSMVEGLDPENLKKGDLVETQKEVKMKIITLTVGENREIVPMFTSPKEAQKGKLVSLIRYEPQDFIPMLLKMKKDVVINPFDKSRFLVSVDMIEKYLEQNSESGIKALQS